MIYIIHEKGIERMKLGEGVEAAIHCAATLAGLDEGATMPGAALAQQFGLSPSYLLKHLNALTAAGILFPEWGWWGLLALTAGLIGLVTL